MTLSQLDAVAGVLTDPGNSARSADEVAQLILDALESARRRQWRYAIIAQDRSRPAASGLRQFCPTWVRVGYYTLADAAAAARAERKEHPEVRVMTAQIVALGQPFDPTDAKEVIA